jgi:tRNA dimethylallyltransferase
MLPGQVLVVTGPTASGKTDVAMALFDRLGGPDHARLISVDSALIYIGMDIGTAKPSAAVMQRYPHALVDIRDPAEAYSAADFVADADAVVAESLAAGQVPILVGGTMLYHRCFREGIAELPSADAALRDELVAELQARGAQAMHDDLLAVDANAAAGIHPNNTQRLLRALEVYRLTGKPMSQQWARQETLRQRLGVDVATFVLPSIDRAELHQCIEHRFDAMLAAGFLDEVSELHARADLTPTLPSMRAVGYRQAWQHLDGELSHRVFRDQAIAATRQLAKRQLTWLRGWQDRWQDVHTLTTAAPEDAAQQIYQIVAQA